ncbi:restriction endonuclease [Streptomyces angustmyceticus]|uniref:restriction endonuclease n=1 Tax=Streptomyces angustmyceticus TaxID=285578 RepID=UPI0021AF70D2|nr:restriction endonuclease [Streptomyces angustmyceticus]
MVTPIRPSGAPVRRRQVFSLRQLTFSFGMVVIGVVGVGLTLKKAIEGASAHPGSALIVGLVVLSATMAFVRWGRRRRVGRVAVDGVVPVDSGAGAVACPPVACPPEPALAPGDFARMDADAFEAAVAGLCERDGCGDVQVVGGANDLGADVVAVAPDGRKVVLQCKRYGPANKVGSQDLQRFGGTCFAVHGAEVAAVVTTGEFTDPAVEYAAACGILCFAQRDLDDWAAGTGPAPWE